METKDLTAALGRIEEKAGKVDELELRLEEVEATSKRLEKMETRMLRPNGEPNGGTFVTAEQREHAELFKAWLRAPHSKNLQHRLLDMEQKTASGTSDAAGGYLVPELLSSSLLKRVRDVSPWRSLVRTIAVSSSNFKLPLNRNDSTTGWAGETATRSATDEPTLEQCAPTFGMLYSYVSASEELLMDSAFDVGQWLIEAAGDAMAEAEGVAIVSGNGTNKLTGFLNATPATAGDDDSPERSYPALQYIASGAAGAFEQDRLGSPPGNPTDCLVDLVFALKAGYRNGATFVMNSSTASTVRKFKDGDGRALWVDSLTAGTPDRLLGYPVVISEQMPDVGSNTFPIAFGNWQSGYVLADQGNQMRVTIDDNITTPGLVKFYVRGRRGGAVYDSNAIKLLKMAAS